MTAPIHGPGTAATAAQLISASSTASGFRGFAARRPIAALLIMVFSIGYPLMIMVALAVHRVIPGYGLIGRLPIPPDELSGLLLTWFALLPAALYVTWAADGRDGLRQLRRRVTRWRFGVGWWLFVLTALPLLTVGVGLLLGDTLAAGRSGRVPAGSGAAAADQPAAGEPVGGDRLGRGYADPAGTPTQPVRGGLPHRHPVRLRPTGPWPFSATSPRFQQ